MEFTIRPLAKFLAAQPTRESFTRGDLRQLENNIQKTLVFHQKNRSPGGRRAARAHEKYLEILATAHPYFAQHKSISRTAWRQQISARLISEGFTYFPQQHAPCHNNSFHQNDFMRGR